MRKVTLITLAMVMIFALAACNTTNDPSVNPDDSATVKVNTVELPAEDPFMKVTIPEGWEYNEARSTSSQVYITKIDSSYPEQVFQFNKSSDDAQEAYDSSLAFWKESRTEMEDKMYGFATYKRLGFTWDSDAPSVCLYTDWDNHEGQSIEVNCFCIDPEDDIIQELMQSVSYF